METIEMIKTLLAEMEVDAKKFYDGNDSAGTRTRLAAQKIKNLAQDLRKNISEVRDERKSK